MPETKYIPDDKHLEFACYNDDGTKLIFDFRYFDCNCDEFYIHRKSEHEVCPRCNAHHEDVSDSRLNELIHFENHFNYRYL
jgi:Zn finger protein HypA/HybF involved in hydrogenase expression